MKLSQATQNDMSTATYLQAAVIAAHEAGFEANYEGLYLNANPHAEGSDEHRAWTAGHAQAQDTRAEWEETNRERANLHGED